jgi:hypothetical protein
LVGFVWMCRPWWSGAGERVLGAWHGFYKQRGWSGDGERVLGVWHGVSFSYCRTDCQKIVLDMWTNVDNRFPMAMIFDACMSQELKKSLWLAENCPLHLNFVTNALCNAR